MVEPNAYQVGIVAKVFNSDTSSRLISGATIEPLTFQFSGGNGYIKKFFITEGKSTNEEDVAIKPNDFGEVKLLLPIKWIAEIQIPLNFIFLSSFTIHFKDGVADLSDVKADRYGNFDRFISPDEWSRLLKPSSTINLDVVSYKTTPASANTPGQ
jgi:hypothetical protein